MRISDWSSDVCSSDLIEDMVSREAATVVSIGQSVGITPNPGFEAAVESTLLGAHEHYDCWRKGELPARWHYGTHPRIPPIVCQMHEGWDALPREYIARRPDRSEEHTSELQSLMRISYAVFCLKKKNNKNNNYT